MFSLSFLFFSFLFFIFFSSGSPYGSCIFSTELLVSFQSPDGAVRYAMLCCVMLGMEWNGTG